MTAPGTTTPGTTTPGTTTSGQERARQAEAARQVRIVVVPGDVWRAGLVLVAVVAVASFGWFVLSQGSSVLSTVVFAWFASLAMEPAVRRLATRMPRGAATGLVMVAIALFLVLFAFTFGNLFVTQIAQLLRNLPDLITSAVDWFNRRFHTDYQVSTILGSIKLTPAEASGYANTVLGGVVGILGSVVGTLFKALTLTLLAFYFSADGPRLRRWVAGLLPAKAQRVFITVWDLTTVKTGGYVGGRVLLAAINGGTSALVFYLIGLPSWLALGIWTGLVAQLIPTIGTYISIALPVLVGLLSPHPWVGVAALVWGVVYQQVENLTIEPRISARAVNIHPAVSFVSVLLGTAVFGVAGALLSVPVCAMLLSMLDIFGARHELLPELQPDGEQPQPA